MMTPARLQLLQQADAPAGSDGFKLTGHAIEGVGLCRVWLRRSNPWDRYLDPRLQRGAWDVRFYVKLDSAYALDPDFTVRDLDGVLDTWAFDADATALIHLVPNGDPIHDATLAWVRRALGADDAKVEASAPTAPAAGSSEPDPPAAAKPEPETTEAPAAAPTAAAPNLASLDHGWGEAEDVADRVSGSFHAVPEDASGD